MKDQTNRKVSVRTLVSVTLVPAMFAALSAAPAPAQSQNQGQSQTQNATQNQGQNQSQNPNNQQQKLKQYLDAQRQREKARYDKFYGDIAKNELKSGQSKASQIRQDAAAKQQYQWSRDTDRGYIPLHERFPGYVPYSIREGQRNGNIGTGKVKPYSDGAATSPELEAARMKEQMAEEKAEDLKNKSKEKQAMVDEAMTNMESQMQDSKVEGAAILKPHGSNLYIRYYGAEGQTKSSLDAAAVAAQQAALAKQKAALQQKAAGQQKSAVLSPKAASSAQNLPNALPKK